MIYVVSDVHGCYDEFVELLDRIHFSDADEMYLLGDLVDRGPQPVRLLQDLMLRPNVYPILGNHEYMALTVLKKLSVEITEENFETHLTEEDLLAYMDWMKNGGSTTASQFRRLSAEERDEILEYLGDFSLCEQVSASGKTYILVHAGLHHFSKERPLWDYDLSELIFYSPDYGRRYFPHEDTFLVTGHVPTFSIRKDRKPLVCEANGHIAIDCGCVYGGKLAAYCLDEQRACYVDARREPAK